MTELQKQNFEHTQRELAAADAVVRNLTTLRDDNQKSAAYANKKLAETQTILSEAIQKAGVARQRFDAVIAEIAPDQHYGGTYVPISAYESLRIPSCSR